MFIELEEKSSILVVDSNPDLRAYMDRMLNGDDEASLNGPSENLSYLIQGCDRCETATKMIEDMLAQDTPYHMLVVESTLMDGNGLELISQLWQLDADLHVVLCTADSQLNWQKIVDTLGESDQLLILQKPFSDLELRQIVHAMMRKCPTWRRRSSSGAAVAVPAKARLAAAARPASR